MQEEGKADAHQRKVGEEGGATADHNKPRWQFYWLLSHSVYVREEEIEKVEAPRFVWVKTEEEAW